ncbi:MAG: FtsX-like permease family protein [Saprospiraceae bacterium]
MNIEYFIARKVAGTGKKTFTRLIIRIAMVAVAISLAVMIITNSLVTGFKKEISEKIFGFWGHIHITEPTINQSLIDANPISINQDFYPWLDTIRQVEFTVFEEFMGQEVQRVEKSKGGIRHIQTFAIMPGIITVKKEMEGIYLKGVGKDFDWQFMNDYIKEGTKLNVTDSIRSREILISQQTSNRLKVGVQDSFIVNFIVNKEAVRLKFFVAGIYKTGLEEYDRQFALVDIRQIQRLMGWKETEVSGFELFIDDLDDMVPMADYIYMEKLPHNLYAESIRAKRSEIFNWLDLQDINEVVILGLMVIVAIINMVTALLILILERTNMIGILKALGASNWKIRRIFLYHAALIIGAGLFWGNLIGLGLCYLQDKFEIVKLSEADYYLSVAPVEINMWLVLFLNIGTLLVTLLFLIIPSFLVTRISPVKAIRFK